MGERQVVSASVREEESEWKQMIDTRSFLRIYQNFIPIDYGYVMKAKNLNRDNAVRLAWRQS
jgi:hypothetical protein